MGALRSAWPRVRARADRRPVYGGYGTRRYHNTVGAPSSERERLSALRAENAWKTSARAGAEVFEKPSGARRDASRPFSAHATAENGTRARRDRSLARRDTALRLPPVRSSSLELHRGARARARCCTPARAHTHGGAGVYVSRATNCQTHASRGDPLSDRASQTQRRGVVARDRAESLRSAWCGSRAPPNRWSRDAMRAAVPPVAPTNFGILFVLSRRRRSPSGGCAAPTCAGNALARMGDARRESRAERALGCNLTVAAALLQPSIPHCVALLPSIPQD